MHERIDGSGNITRWVVLSRQAALRLTTTCPAALVCTVLFRMPALTLLHSSSLRRVTLETSRCANLTSAQPRLLRRPYGFFSLPH